MFFRLGSFLCFANNLHKHYKKAICTNSIEKNQPKNAKQTPPTYLPYKRSVCLSSLFKTTKAFDVCFSLFLVGCYLNSSLARTASNPTTYILCRFRRFSSRAFRFRHGYIFKPCLIGRRRRAPVCRREICKHIVMFSWLPGGVRPTFEISLSLRLTRFKRRQRQCGAIIDRDDKDENDDPKRKTTCSSDVQQDVQSSLPTYLPRAICV